MTYWVLAGEVPIRLSDALRAALAACCKCSPSE